MTQKLNQILAKPHPNAYIQCNSPGCVGWYLSGDSCSHREHHERDNSRLLAWCEEK